MENITAEEVLRRYVDPWKYKEEDGIAALKEYASQFPRWVKASEQMPEIGDKRLFFVRAQNVYHLVCGLTYKGEFIEFPSGDRPIGWRLDEIEWLSDPTNIP